MKRTLLPTDLLKGQQVLGVYKTKQGWRWRLWGADGDVLANSGQSYPSSQSCLTEAYFILESIPAFIRHENGQWIQFPG